MYALVDCNNFYASCERVFMSDLNGKPVVVLSNNDGCIIACSNEAKALGIAMGAVPFLIEDILVNNEVYMFSSNYTLYADMSRRVTNTLSQFSPRKEIYSIDECFLSFEGMEHLDYLQTARTIKNTVRQNTGIPVGVGMGHTKTLAKIANWYAKKVPENQGVYVIDTEKKRLEALRALEIGEVWGIGRQSEKKLIQKGVLTAYDFTNLPIAWIQENMTVVGLRIQMELLGIPCIELEEVQPKKKAITTSRSFGKMQRNYRDVEEAVKNYASRCALKLRQENSCATLLTVFLNTNVHRDKFIQYHPTITVQLPEATNSTITILQTAEKALQKIFKPGYEYKKVGITASGIVPAKDEQLGLFNDTHKAKHKSVMEALDKINSIYGRDKLHIAAMEGPKKFALLCERKSPEYTTNWDDILRIKV